MSAIKKISVDSEIYNIEDSRVDNIAEQIPDASTETKGLVQIGEGITVSDGVISVDAALPIEVVPEYQSGTLIATISQGNNEWVIYAPQGGGQGDTVTYSSAPQTGTTKLLGTLTINNVPYYINEEAVVVSDTLNAGTTIATITCGNQSWTIKAPAETDPVFQASPAANISAANITAWNNKSDFSGNYNDLTNKPVIPTATSNLVNDSGFITSAQAGDTVSYNQTLGSGVQIGTITINGSTTTIYAPSGGSPSGGDTVSWSGDYTSSTGTQIGTLTISGVDNPIYGPNPGDTVSYSASVATGTALGTLTIDGTAHTIYAPAESEPLFVASPAHDITSADVANWNNKSNFSGSYNDLTNKPTIPSKTSDLTNDSGYVTSASLSGYVTSADVASQMVNTLAAVAFDGDYKSLSSTPGFLSDFNNDTGFITSAALADYVTSADTADFITSADIADCLTSADISVTQVQSAGTKIATITVDNTSTDLYAPNAAGGADWAATSAQSGYIANKPSIAAGVGANSIVEGYGTQATLDAAHAEGSTTEATNYAAHAEGGNTHATGIRSHAEGSYTYAASNMQHAQGKFNVVDSDQIFADIIGNGADNNHRNNAEAIDWNGNLYLAGNAYVGCDNFATVSEGPASTNCGGTKLLKSTDVIASADLATGTKIGTITVNGTATDFYAPTGGGGADWTATSAQSGYIANKPSMASGSGTNAVVVAMDEDIAASGDYSFASNKSQAVGDYSHAEGKGAIAMGEGSHAEGEGFVSSRDNEVQPYISAGLGIMAHAEGSAKATGKYAHAEGKGKAILQIVEVPGVGTYARGNGMVAHAEGASTATGSYSHAEGYGCYAYGAGDHAEGWNTQANSYVPTNQSATTGVQPQWPQHVQGQYNVIPYQRDQNYTVTGDRKKYQFANIIGNGNSSERSNAAVITYSGDQYLSGDLYVNCTDYVVTSAGFNTANCGGTKVLTSADLSNFTVGWSSISNKPNVEKGTGTGAVIVAGESGYCYAQGNYSYAQGRSEATASYSHAEGRGTRATGTQSHAEGFNSQATAMAAHAEGYETSATQTAAHAEGQETHATATYSHAEGYGTEIKKAGGHVQGLYNIVDNNGIFLDIVGNGADSSHRSNAEATDINGNKYIAGGLWLNNTTWTTTSAGVAANGIRVDYCDGDVIDSQETYPENGYGILACYQDLSWDEPGEEWLMNKDTARWCTAEDLTINGISKLPASYSNGGTYYEECNHIQRAPYDADGGTWVLKAFCYIDTYEDDGAGSWVPVYAMKYEWIKESDTTPWDEPYPEEDPPSGGGGDDPDPEDPEGGGDEPEPDPEEEPIEE